MHSVWQNFFSHFYVCGCVLIERLFCGVDARFGGEMSRDLNGFADAAASFMRRLWMFGCWFWLSFTLKTLMKV